MSHGSIANAAPSAPKAADKRTEIEQVRFKNLLRLEWVPILAAIEAGDYAPAP